MPKSKSKSKSKVKNSNKQSQKQNIIVNVNSHNKRKSTHHHHKASPQAPSHIIVPSTNHHMMFMPQPQMPQNNLLGDNNYGIGMNHRLDASLQRINEVADQVQQDALNNDRYRHNLDAYRHQREDEERQNRIDELRQHENRDRLEQAHQQSQRQQRQQREEDDRFYHRDVAPHRTVSAAGNRSRSRSVRNEDEFEEAFTPNVTSVQDATDRIHTSFRPVQNNEELNAHIDHELRFVDAPLSSDQQRVLDDYNERAREAGGFTAPKVVEPSNIIYHTTPLSMNDLASSQFSGTLDAQTSLSVFHSPKKIHAYELQHS